MSTKTLSLVKPRSIGIWVRVSTEFQAQGDSLEHHEVRARQYAASKNWEVVNIYRLEAVSGKSTINHPETKRMLDDVKAGRISALIVSKFARLVRNTRELLEMSDVFRGCNAELVSLDEPINIATSSGRLFLSVISALAEWEREEIGARVAASIPVRAKLGKSLGGAAPFGYKWEGNSLIVDPKEAEIRRMIYELFIQHKRKKTVARLLNNAGYRTRNGSRFSDTTVSRLLCDPTAKGLRRANYTKSTGDGKHWIEKPVSEWVMTPIEPILSEEVWDQANRILAMQSSKFRQRGKKPVQLFGGMLQCACGCKMYKATDTPKYVCKNCRNKLPVVDGERLFLESIRAVYAPERIISLFNRVQLELETKRKLHTELLDRMAALDSEKDKCYRAYTSGRLDLEDFGRYFQPLKEEARTVDAQRAELQGDIDALQKQCSTPERIARGCEALLKRWWPKASFEKRRQLIENIVRKVVVSRDVIVITFHNLYTLPSDEGVDFTALILTCGLEVEMQRGQTNAARIEQLSKVPLLQFKTG